MLVLYSMIGYQGCRVCGLDYKDFRSGTIQAWCIEILLGQHLPPCNNDVFNLMKISLGLAVYTLLELYHF